MSRSGEGMLTHTDSMKLHQYDLIITLKLYVKVTYVTQP